MVFMVEFHGGIFPWWNFNNNPWWNFNNNSNVNVCGDVISQCIANHSLTICNNLFDKNTIPTHENKHFNLSSVLDLILTNSPYLCTHFNVFNSRKYEFYPFSDHWPVVLTVQSSFNQNSNKFIFNKEMWCCDTMDDENWNNFKNEIDNNIKDISMETKIKNLFQHVKNNPSIYKNKSMEFKQKITEEYWGAFKSILIDSALKIIGKKIIKSEHKNWYKVDSIRLLLKEVRKSRSSLCKVRKKYLLWVQKYKKWHEDFVVINPPFRSNYLIQHGIFIQNKLSTLKLLLVAKTKIKNKCQRKFKNSIKKFHLEGWNKLINGLHDEKQKNQVQWKIFRKTQRIPVSDISQIKNNQNKLPENIHESLNNLASYYSSISTDPDRRGNDDDQIEMDLDTPSFNSLDDIHNNGEISFQEFFHQLKSVSTSTALGPDDISPYFLKNNSDLFYKCYHLFINLIFKFGTIPFDWTKSNIFALFKKGDKNQPENYRPISLTSICIRTYERMLLNKVWGIINSNKKLHPLQAGFRKQHGTLDGLYWFIRTLQKKFLKNNKNDNLNIKLLPVAFLDFSKAFDKINIPLVLLKLFNSGIRGNLLKFFIAFLSNRRLRTIFFSQTSNWYSINMGTPQGSVLGPVLFLIYINDLLENLNLLPGIEAGAYADDVRIIPNNINFNFHSNCILLQHALNLCSQWAIVNKMTFSKNKSNILCFHNINNILNDYRDGELLTLLSNFKLSSYGSNEFLMDLVPNYKFLGITFNSNIRKLYEIHWSDVIKSVEKRSRNISRLLYQKSLPIQVGTILVSSIVRSKIAYGLSLVRCTQKIIFKKLQSLLAQPLKILLKLSKQSSIIATLVECCFSLLTTWQEKLTIQYANRLSKLDENHYSFIQFYQHDYNSLNRKIIPSRSYKYNF